MADENEIQAKPSLKCPNCDKSIEYPEILNIARNQYIILLFGNLKDDLWGIFCFDCSTIFVSRINKTLTYPLIRDIEGPYPFNRLYYDSTPSYKLHDNQNQSFFLSMTYASPLTSPLPISLDLQPPPHSEDEYFCSYETELMYIGEQAAFYWYSYDNVIDAVKVENETKVKCLPRYVLNYDTWTKLEKFFWNFFVKEKMLQFTEGLFNFTQMTQTISMETPFHSEVKQRYDFLDIITSVLQSTEFSHFISKKQADSDTTIDSNSNELTKIRFTSVFDYIWSRFDDSRIKNLINSLSTKLLYDYANTRSKIPTNHSTLDKLVIDYVFDFFESTAALIDGKTSKPDIPENLLNEVSEIESQFPAFKQIVTNNPHMMKLKVRIAKISRLRDQPKLDILLLGEPGTGKELFARAIHNASGRKGEFIALNCAEISSNLFESELFGHVKGAFTDATRDKKGAVEAARNGTLFLDEIGDLTLEHQAKLLRCIQEREFKPVGVEKPKTVDVRFVFATNRDLSAMICERAFREDLYQRINAHTFVIPTLSERRDDIPILVDHFIVKYDSDFKRNDSIPRIGIEDSAIEFLCNLDWRTGVRELENCIKRVVIWIIADEKRRDINLDDFEFMAHSDNRQPPMTPESVRPFYTRRTKVSDEDIIYQMAKCNNIKSEVARVLGVDRKTIGRRLREIRRR